SNSEYYIKGTLNGQVWNWQVPTDLSGYVVGSSAAVSNDQGTISGGLTALVSAASGLQPQFGIELKTFTKKEDEDAPAIFNAFVTTGSWTYANTLDYTTGTKSVVVYYTDSNGKTYSSIGSQSGSSMSIISAKPVPGSVYNSDSGLKVKLTFSCKLYPTDGTGNTLTITNTEATVFFDEQLIDY
ncbi:MAG: hypothetical protein ACTHJ8_00260, partial [Mucilaginibacter sp.]